MFMPFKQADSTAKSPHHTRHNSSLAVILQKERFKIFKPRFKIV